MELFIRADDIYMEIHKVTLKDGHIPMIGDQLPSFLSENDHGYCNPYEIEPAVWFKVMVVDSISIDCTKRAIMWNSDSSLPYVESEKQDSLTHSGQSKRRHRVSESMYIGGELYGFESDLDELFDTLQLNVVNFASSQISREDFNSEVMRMLHCHVLPLIKLTTEDVPKMKKVFAEEEKYIRNIDEEIIQKDKQMESIGQAMQRQRDAFLSSFVTIKDDQSMLTSSAKMCNKDLATVLVQDCESDLMALHQKLDDLQREVEEAKRSLALEEWVEIGESTGGSVSSEDEISQQLVKANESDLEKTLREKRVERNGCHKKLKGLLCARENLRVFISEVEEEEEIRQKRKSFMKSFKSSPQHQPLPIHNVYMGMRDTLTEVRNKAKALVDKKVLLISVKEALRTTLEELAVNEESLGCDVGVMHGSRPTDVLHRSRKPREWLTLGQQVSDLVGHHSNQVCLLHNNFTKIVADRCQAGIFEKRLMDVSHNAVRTGESVSESDSRKSDSGVYVENKLFGIQKSKAGEESSNEERPKVQIDNLHIEKTSPVNSIISDTSDLDTGSESRNSSGNTSQSELSSLPSDVHATTPCSRACDSLVQMEGQFGDEDIVIVHNNSRDHLRRAIDDLKQEIQGHFNDMCKLIQTSIENHTQTVTKKVWLCYEHHFYEATMEPLMELYKYAFQSVSDRLQRLVPHLTVEDLDLDDTIIANMLEEKVMKLPNSETDPELAALSDLESDAETDPFNSSNVSQTKSEPTSPSTDNLDDVDESVAPPEGLSSAEKEDKKEGGAVERRVRSFRGRLMTHPVQECTTPPNSKKPPEDSGNKSTGGLQRIKIHYPMSVTVVRNRQSWPQAPVARPTNADLELGLDALHVPKKDTGRKSPTSTFDNIRRSLFAQRETTLPIVSEIEKTEGVTPLVYRDVKLKPEFQEKFIVAKNCLKETLDGVTPLIKLQSLMRCLREVTNCLSDYQFQYNNNDAGACSDDIIDMLIILLLNCDVSVTAALYPHLMFLADTLPPFFEGGPYQFCLVQFSVAYQFLQDRLLLKNRGVVTQSCL